MLCGGKGVTVVETSILSRSFHSPASNNLMPAPSQTHPQPVTETQQSIVAIRMLLAGEHPLGWDVVPLAATGSRRVSHTPSLGTAVVCQTPRSAFTMWA